MAAKQIRAGEQFTAENVGVKRPGTGISPMRWDEVIGRYAVKDFSIDELILYEKVCVVTGTRAEYGLLRWVMEELINRVSWTSKLS